LKQNKSVGSCLFLDHLAEIKAVTRGRTEVALVGMRVNSRTLAATQLSEFLARQEYQTLTMIHPTQLYSYVAATGTAGVFKTDYKLLAPCPL
jgi:chromosome partitioning protein